MKAPTTRDPGSGSEPEPSVPVASAWTWRRPELRRFGVIDADTMGTDGSGSDNIYFLS
jgi:hypothetical protein